MDCECTQFVRCMKCKKIIKCSRYDTSSLLQHIQNDHPEIMMNGNGKVSHLHELAAQHGISSDRLSQISKMTGMSEREMADEAERYLTAQSSASSKKGPYKLNRPDSKDLSRRQFYRASIEKWTPTEGPIFCPKCGCSRPPMIKTHTELYASNTCCVSCVFSCWPFCFLPCLIPRDNREYLHCANCQNFLGLYDRENNCVKPNRTYVECRKQTDTKPCSSGDIKCN